MDQEFKFRLKAKGGTFNVSTELTTSLGILYNQSAIFSYCVERACDKFIDKEEFYPIPPRIELEYARRGSLLSSFFVDFPSSFAMIQPLVGGYAWDLFKQTFEFVKILGEMRAKLEIPSVKIIDSPGSLAVNVTGNNNTVMVSTDVFGSAKRNIKHVAGLANAIGPQGAESLGVSRIMGRNRIEPGGVVLNTKNHHLYSDLEQEHISMEVREYPANIYRLNTKSRNGLAEIGGKSVSFDIEGGDLGPFIDALHGSTCYLHARARMMVNQFGESRLDHLFVAGITPFIHAEQP